MRPDQQPRNLFQLGQKDMLNRLMQVARDFENNKHEGCTITTAITIHLEDYERWWIERNYDPDFDNLGPKEYESEWYKKNK